MGKTEILGIAVGTGDESRGVSFVPAGTGTGSVRSTHRWKRWAIIGRPYGTSTVGKTPPLSSAGALSTLSSGSATEDGEDGLRREDWTLFKTPEYPESGGQSRAQMTDNETIAKQENLAAGRGDRKPSSVSRDQSSVTEHTATGQKGNLTPDLDLNHNLVLSGSAGVARPGPAANEAPAGMAENQGGEPEQRRGLVSSQRAGGVD